MGREEQVHDAKRTRPSFPVEDLAIKGEHLDMAHLLFDFLRSGNPAVTLKDSVHTFCPHNQLVQSFRAIK